MCKTDKRNERMEARGLAAGTMEMSVLHFIFEYTHISDHMSCFARHSPHYIFGPRVIILEPLSLSKASKFGG